MVTVSGTAATVVDIYAFVLMVSFSNKRQANKQNLHFQRGRLEAQM